MNRIQLAKLVDWAGELKSRKRLQKVVYLLQAAGCPIQADFTLHLFGPYSHDLADLANQMVEVGLLDESEEANAMGGRTFSYKLSDAARQQLRSMDHGQDALDGREALAKRLLEESDLRKLEFAATVAYFRPRGQSWNEARQAAAKFKNQPPDSAPMKDAEELAREVLESVEVG